MKEPDRASSYKLLIIHKQKIYFLLKKLGKDVFSTNDK